MNNKFRDIAGQAGFGFWQEEPWKPEDETIDWASADEKTFVKYSELLIAHSLIDFCRKHYDICGDRVEVQVEKYVKEVFGENND